MEEKLVIKNFGPVESLEIDVRTFTIFIGSQGSGMPNHSGSPFGAARGE